MIARPEVKKYQSQSSMTAFYDVLIDVKNKSRHFPTLIKAGTTKKVFIFLLNNLVINKIFIIF